jgi:hypothetical protein
MVLVVLLFFFGLRSGLVVLLLHATALWRILIDNLI